MATQAAWVTATREADRLVIAVGGRLNLAEAARLDRELGAIAADGAAAASVDIAGLEALDTAGAWVLHRAIERLRAAGCAARVSGARPEHGVLLGLVARNAGEMDARPRRERALRAFVEHVGRATLEVLDDARDMLAFLGLTTVTLGRALAAPRRIRFTALVSHMERAGFDALPIVGLISFLIGIVIAYQGADQLRRFGADVFVVNLVGITILREIGILLTAVVVAGRSGSAFTAAIGAMMVRQEVDAMRTLGLDPIEVLVVPRLLALVLTLPLLAFFADILGLLGGGVMAWGGLGMTPAQYIARLNAAVPLWSFWVGIIKAPVFAFIIAMVGCCEGLRVEGSAESVGRHTTKAVVESIFLVIVFDAALSIVFSYLGV